MISLLLPPLEVILLRAGEPFAAILRYLEIRWASGRHTCVPAVVFPKLVSFPLPVF